MNVTALVGELWADGVSLQVRGDRLIVEGPHEKISLERQNLIRDYKQQIIVMLSDPTRVGVLTDELISELVFLWDERAAIIEYDGGIDRPQAESLAREFILRFIRTQYPNTICDGSI